MRATSLRVAAAALLLAGVSARVDAAETAERTLTVAGTTRAYLLTQSAQTGPRPALIVLHGGTLSAAQARRDMRIEPLVDREGLVAVYPDARDHQWNDGRLAGPGRHD